MGKKLFIVLALVGLSTMTKVCPTGEEITVIYLYRINHQNA
ncbi:hypothetical protein EV11_0660 [Prochlorococcus sp. SS52]|nr:hypothetical protein EV04_1329 [Prochlorococcus marinus str. LG]KGG21592.1 hypothetical protein EV08_0681 [Prochlorococcus marinus str. SS2]KGG23066.1 hypothetical protein EV09_1811 [Prochlorococcus marinus str. SS35]KGG33773.1 hypothetical protein EV10_0210 [Prochlorococcus marinus str. SS51]KGG36876.1 hypothetical protein EV11_0660 [Prochlorococcus sp. SS52]